MDIFRKFYLVKEILQLNNLHGLKTLNEVPHQNKPKIQNLRSILPYYEAIRLCVKPVKFREKN